MPKRLNRSELKRLTSYMKRNGLKASYYKAVERLSRDMYEKNQTYDVFDIIGSREELELEASKQFKFRYKISIIVPAYETKEEYLKEMLGSVLSQTYDNWEICIADASETDSVKNTVDSVISENEAVRPKIKYKRLSQNNGISANANEALKLADGEYAAFLDHDDVLSRNALFEVMCVLDNGIFPENGHANRYRFIYSDEDKFKEGGGEHFDYHIKPDFDLELLRTNNYICHLLVVDRELAVSVGGFDSKYDGSQDHDFILRAVEKLKREEIAHIPKILYHWRSHKLSTATNPDSKLYAYEAGKRAVKDHLSRLSIKADVSDTEHLGFYRVKYNVSADDLAKVVTMTPDEFKNKPIDEINGSGYEYIMILEDGIKPQGKGYVEEMLGFLLRDEVGCVGGLMIGRDGKIESAGYETSEDGHLTPMFRGLNRHFSGYLHRAKLAREVKGVCTGCMMVKKSALTAEHILKHGYLVIYSPYSVFKRVR